MTALRWPSFDECMERVLWCPWMNSAYVALLFLCLYWAVLSVIDAVWRRNFTLMCYFAVRWQWRLCIDLRLLNVWNNGYRIGPKPTARTFICIDLYALALIGRCYWWSMQYDEVVISPSYTLQWRWRLCIDLRSLNVWNGCRVGARWTNRPYVYIAWTRVIGVQCSIIKVVV